MDPTLLAALITDLYEHEAVGGFLHIVLDDLNVDDSYIHWCLTEANRPECDRQYPWCHDQHDLIGKMLLDMPLENRVNFLRKLPT